LRFNAEFSNSRASTQAIKPATNDASWGAVDLPDSEPTRVLSGREGVCVEESSVVYSW
jgi:hypothetical protein